jgi:Putative metallopeptidase
MSDLPAPTASRDHGMDRFLCACAVLFVLLLGATSARSQTPPAQTPAPGTKMDDAVHELSSDPRLKNMPQPQQRDLIEFVTGNMLFVGFHELGHAVIQELGLPVLGRQEDAADSFATLALLKLGTNFSLNMLVQAARGWFLMARRDRKEGDALQFYDEHGLDKAARLRHRMPDGRLQ